MITKLTYTLRQKGEPIIYFAWGAKSNNPDESYLIPRPTKSEKEYYDFFTKTEPGKTLPKYTLYIYENGKVEFTKKVYSLNNSFSKSSIN